MRLLLSGLRLVLITKTFAVIAVSLFVITFTGINYNLVLSMSGLELSYFIAFHYGSLKRSYFYDN